MVRPHNCAPAVVPLLAIQLFRARACQATTGVLLSVWNGQLRQSICQLSYSNLSPPFANKEHGIGADDVLLDVGCGVGLAMLTFRHMLPCKRVHGIELSKRLFDVCYKNVQCALGKDADKQGWLRVDHADATKFQIPLDVTFAFVYNSFQVSFRKQACCHNYSVHTRSHTAAPPAGHAWQQQ